MFNNSVLKGLAHYSNNVFGDGLYSSTYQIYTPPTPPTDDFILQDNDDFLLQDNGDKIIAG